jgi:putative Mg2+ transporter-C (MgtC) family protein
MLISDVDAYTRLITSLVLSGLIGMEREYHLKPAGLRTNVMVGLGSCLMTIASVRAAELANGAGMGVDPTRIAAQIITGIGFIGAGAILRPQGNKGNVVGLTTAATLWVVSGLGIAVGLGFYAPAIATTLLVFFTFFFLSAIVTKLREYTKLHPPKFEHDEDLNEGVR